MQKQSFKRLVKIEARKTIKLTPKLMTNNRKKANNTTSYTTRQWLERKQ